MEHIVQFGITIDDEAIKQRIEHQALQSLQKSINDDVKKQLGKQSRWDPDTWVQEKAVDIIREVIDEERQSIIDRVVESLTRSVTNSKAYKEAIKMKVMSIPPEDFVKAGVVDVP